MYGQLGWNKEQLIKEKEQLVRNNVNSKYASNYSEMISILDSNYLKPGKELSIREKIKRELRIYETFYCRKKVYSDSEFRQLLELAQEIIALSDLEIKSPLKKIMTDSEIIEISEEFYNQLDQEYSNCTKKILEEDNMVHFLSSDVDFPTIGVTYYITSLGKSYILLKRRNNIEDIITLNHEIMHCNEHFMRNNIDQNDKSYMFSETGALYSELKTIEFLGSQNINEELLKVSERNNFNVIGIFADNFITSYSTMDFLEKNKNSLENMSMCRIREYLKSIGLYVEGIYSAIEGDLFAGYKYVTSYVVANYVNQNYDLKDQVRILKDLNENPRDPITTLESYGIPTTAEGFTKSLRKKVSDLQ